MLRKVKLSYTSSDIQCIKKKSVDFKIVLKFKEKEKKKETVAQKQTVFTKDNHTVQWLFCNNLVEL